MAIIATCHCGKSRIELPSLPASATECNCTFCARTGAVWAYFPEGELQFVSQEALRTYSASEGSNLHHFCGVCGIQTWGDSPDYTSMDDAKDSADAGEVAMSGIPRRHAINLRTIDDLDWSSIEIEKVDGRSGW